MEYDISQWRVNDKGWLRVRKKQWREVKATLKHMRVIKNKWAPAIKDFFIMGGLSAEVIERDFIHFGYIEKYNPELPLYRVTCATLLELWLTEDRREANLEYISHKYGLDDIRWSRRLFLDELDYYPKKGSLYLGRDEEICRYLLPERCRLQDYPHIKEEHHFITQATYVYGHVVTNLKKWLVDEKPNYHNFVRHCLPAWKDATVWKWKRDGDVAVNSIISTFSIVGKLQREPETYDSLAVKVAAQIVQLFNDPELPKPILAAVKEGLTPQK